MLQIGVGMFNEWLENESIDELLKNIKERGASFIELKISAKNWKKRKPQVEKILQNGLNVTVHAPFEGKYNPFFFEKKPENETFNLYKELLKSLDEIVKLKKSRLLVNTHAASGEPKLCTFNSLMKKSIKFFKWLLEEIENNKYNIGVTVELLPFDPGKIKVGTTSGELLALSKSVEGKLNFCWDLGHFYTNQVNKLKDKLSKKFLAGAKHIHIHDICDTKDHMPLKFDTLPYLEYLSCLRNHRSRTIVLELNYQNTKLIGEPYQLLYYSIDKLRRSL